VAKRTLDELGVGFGVVEINQNDDSLGGEEGMDRLAVEVANAAGGKTTVSQYWPNP